jgi:Flp pilus assembly pilin Flp
MIVAMAADDTRNFRRPQAALQTTRQSDGEKPRSPQAVMEQEWPAHPVEGIWSVRSQAFVSFADTASTELPSPQAQEDPQVSRGGESPLIEFLNRLFHEDEKGQTMAEYAVVLGVITIAVVVALGTLSTKITSVLGNVITQM